MNQFYPLPTTGVTLPSGNNYIVNEKAYSYWDNAVVKIDQQLAAHDEGVHQVPVPARAHDQAVLQDPTPGNGESILHNLQTIVAFNETHIFTPNLINDFRSGLTRNVNNEHPFDMGIRWGALAGHQRRDDQSGTRGFSLLQREWLRDPGRQYPAADPIHLEQLRHQRQPDLEPREAYSQVRWGHAEGAVLPADQLGV